MNSTRLLLRLIMSACALLGLSSCSLPSILTNPTPSVGLPIVATPAASLSEIPVYVGEMTFNESNNRGFSQEPVIAWASDDLQITSNGRIAGTFRVTTVGGVGSNVRFKDILFLQVRGNYIWPNMGDIQRWPLSDVIPLMAQAADEQSAEFRVDTSFQIPPLVLDYGDDLPLESVAVNLTWVRVFKNEQNLYVQVFPGDASRYPPEPEIRFDQDSRPLTGRFGYYFQLPISDLKGGRTTGLQGEFEYFTWIQENIKW